MCQPMLLARLAARRVIYCPCSTTLSRRSRPFATRIGKSAGLALVDPKTAAAAGPVLAPAGSELVQADRPLAAKQVPGVVGSGLERAPDLAREASAADLVQVDRKRVASDRVLAGSERVDPTRAVPALMVWAQADPTMVASQA